MTTHLRKRDLESITSMINGWTGRITWPKVVEKAEEVLGRETTRQTLANYIEIRNAYKIKKSSVKDVPESASVHTLRAASDRIKRLTEDVRRLAEDNQHLLNQFIVWQYNASLANLSKEDLSRPMPAIDRKGEKQLLASKETSGSRSI